MPKRIFYHKDLNVGAKGTEVVSNSKSARGSFANIAAPLAAFVLKISRWAWIPTLSTYFDYFKPCFLYFLSRGICCTKMDKLGGKAFSQLFKKVP
jgi:hypothetical protein